MGVDVGDSGQGSHQQEVLGLSKDFGYVEFDKILVELSNQAENMTEEMIIKFCPSA